ncbi:MAG: hypothetical protein LBN21_01115 [Treponema sp.]|jgi:hypothetical protein|nr:hypothetical protein [Treponema sp.]
MQAIYTELNERIKLELTDTLIEGAIDSISGFIVAKAADSLHKPVDEVMDIFLQSNTYKLLSNKNTGLYWDSLSETLDMFMGETQSKFGACPILL